MNTTTTTTETTNSSKYIVDMFTLFPLTYCWSLFCCVIILIVLRLLVLKNSYNDDMLCFRTSPIVKGQYQQRDRHVGRNDHANNINNTREHRYYRYPYNQKHESRSEHMLRGQNQGSKDQDPYDGLMTPKEKEWIIKIQLLQLQTDNPYLDDAYYTVRFPIYKSTFI